MVELDYNNPEHKTMCEEIILAKRLKRIQYYSTYGKGTFFYDWGVENKLWTRRVEEISVEKQYMSREGVYRLYVTTLSGIRKVLAKVPIEVIHETGGF